MVSFSDEVLLVALWMASATFMALLSCAWYCIDLLPSTRMADFQKNYVENVSNVIPTASFEATSPISVVPMSDPSPSATSIEEENDYSAHHVDERDGSDIWEMPSPGGRRSRPVRPRSGRPLTWRV